MGEWEWGRMPSKKDNLEIVGVLPKFKEGGGRTI